MTLSDAISLAQSRGFEPISQTPDFERHDEWACYARRVVRAVETWEGTKQVHEYLLLISRDGVFLEAVLEEYLAPKQTKRPKGRATFKKRGDKTDVYSDHQYKGFTPIYATILRGREGLESL